MARDKATVGGIELNNVRGVEFLFFLRGDLLQLSPS